MHSLALDRVRFSYLGNGLSAAFEFVVAVPVVVRVPARRYVVGSPKSLIQPILLTVLGQSSDWPSEVDVPLPNLRCCGSLLAVLVVRRRPLCCLLPCTGARSGVGANDETFPLLAAALRRQAAH